MKSEISESERPLHSKWNWFEMTSKEKDLVQDSIMDENSSIRSNPFPDTHPFPNSKIIKIKPKETSTAKNKSTEKLIKSKPKKSKSLTSSVTNLSNHSLTETQMSLLEKGLKFIPSRYKVNKLKLLADLADWESRMKLAEFFMK